MSSIALATADVMRSLSDAGAAGAGVGGTIERIRLGLGEAMYTGEEGDLHHDMGALTESVGAAVEERAPDAGEQMTAAVGDVVA